MNFLNNIYRPEDIQNYDVASLKILCQEIRQRIIDVVSSTGGHLASNLGVVELTVALHYVFRAPVDKFIFDVSHQSYPHKLLTGRNDKFSTIRQFKGLCGFSNPKESSYDHFYAGHAGTALSLALGMAKSRDMQEENHHIIPILGDASFTCGITLEALNNIPQKLSKFIVILNDNNMSISNNVGAIPRILGSHFFEPFGLSYTGQIDGHDIEKIIETLNSLKNGSGPALLHVLTTKGKGMSQAIENPISYHGCRPFDKSTGLFFSATEKRSTFPQIFGSHILRMAEKDAHIVAVTPAMPAGSCLTAFMKKFPERCLDVGIAEEHAVTFCGGIAHNTHIKVVMSIYATFLQRALDNLFQDVCLQNAPVVFAIDRAGISGPDGSTHHGIYDIAFLRVMPGMIICQPRDGLVLKELLESAFHWKAPTAIRYPNLPTEEKEGPLKYRPPGKAEILHLGQNILIVALGHMCAIALSVHALLQEEEIDATIVDPIFIKPLDEELFSELLATHTHIVTIEEHCVHGGLGSALNSFIASKRLSHIKILNLGIPDLFVEHGSHAELLDALGLSPEKIVKTLVTDFLPCEAPL